MNRLRLADVRAPIARVANECTTSERVIELANEAHRRLVAKGNWLGTVARYEICVSNSGCLTWPRQIETILAYWRCDTPGTIRNGWYESSISGPGLLNSDDMQTNTLLERGTACVFDQPSGTASKIAVTSDVPEADSPRILIRGYDENTQWIRTEIAPGQWIDGEYVDISNVVHYSTKFFTQITEVVKDVTRGVVRLMEYDTTIPAVIRSLAYYEPDETLPIYRCSLVPGLSQMNGCGCSNCGENACTNTKITVAAKLRHIDVAVDNDFFLLGNLGALKLMVMAILKEERNLFDESVAYEAKAVKELQDELHSYEGDGVVPVVKQESNQTWGGNVLSPVTLGYRIY